MNVLQQHVPGGTWKADQYFTSVTFSVRHLGIRNYRAGFREIDATLDVDAGTLVASVPVATLDLNNPEIRRRILSAEFLDAERHPEVRFAAEQVRGEGEARDVVVAGELTIHGHTRAVQARGRLGLPGPGLLSDDNRVSLELSATIDRREFGLDWQEQLPGGGLTLAYEVTIDAAFEFAQPL